MELERIIVHEDYNPETVQHDIALLKLKQPVDLAVRGEEILHLLIFVALSSFDRLGPGSDGIPIPDPSGTFF